jgi:hypothetical protein
MHGRACGKFTTPTRNGLAIFRGDPSQMGQNLAKIKKSLTSVSFSAIWLANAREFKTERESNMKNTATRTLETLRDDLKRQMPRYYTDLAPGLTRGPSFLRELPAFSNGPARCQPQTENTTQTKPAHARGKPMETNKKADHHFGKSANGNNSVKSQPTTRGCLATKKGLNFSPGGGTFAAKVGGRPW